MKPICFDVLLAKIDWHIATSPKFNPEYEAGAKLALQRLRDELVKDAQEEQNGET